MANERSLFDAALNQLRPGINLVEASAGTGKTYAIAMLVLRFVTELSLPVENILIVTFTKAATEELAARIRSRLAEARGLLMGLDEEVDPTLLRWAESLEDSTIALDKIKIALNDIDRAAIFTIHSFCQRMLQDQALESGQLFDVELKTDMAQVRLQVAEDFWRHTLYGMTPRQCGIITSVFQNPEKLLLSIMPFPGHGSVIEPKMATIAEAGQHLEQCYKSLVSWWHKNTNRETLFVNLQQLVDEKKVKSEFVRGFSGWWQELGKYFSGSRETPPENLQFLGRHGFSAIINGSKVRGKKKEELLAGLNLPDAEVVSFIRAADNLVLTMRTTLADSLNFEIEKRMQQDNVMSYNDLIIRLHQVVTSVEGHFLRQKLRQRFLAVLIDEFQDTDLEQWQIFNSVFGKGAYLYLIGDPKQAIYRFRGADIKVYFLARESALHKLTLNKNYRSHPGNVEEVNRLFLSRKNPFVYEDAILDFSPVSAAKEHEDGYLSRGGKVLSNMVYCQLDESPETKDGRWTSGKASASILQFVVKETSRLLDGSVVFCETTEKDGKLERALLPRDIAILVRNNRHAEEYLQCFARAGIPAVIASRKSVYQTEECVAMYTIMKSLSKPSDAVLLKRAMAVTWLGLSGNALYEIWQNEELYDSWYSRFQSYAETWHSKGFLLMMNRFLQEEDVFTTLGAGPFFERRIANINQLLELIQEVETTNLFGPAQTLLWLRNTMSSHELEGEQELRLESDEDAIRIVTMHGAKGLEYPVVFCPFLWYRLAKILKEKNCIACHDSGVRVIDLGSEHFEERRSKAAKEDFAEDLRLLYVAVTRAKQRCYTIWCDAKGISNGPVDSFSSPLGYLLFPDGGVPFASQQETLQSLCCDSTVSYLSINAHDTEKILYNTNRGQHDFLLKQSTRNSFYTNWQMTSYSALASISEHYEDKTSSETASFVDSPISEFKSLPAGASFGNVVHDVLEKIPFKELLQPEKHRKIIRLICSNYGVDADLILLEKLLKNIVETPLVLPGYSKEEGVSLAALDEKKSIKEMMFYFHLARSETREMNAILSRERTVIPLGEKVVEGYLTGFVDLVFEYNNKFYVADYKTNKLGDSLNDYHNDALIRAMASHNYGLQYWLYSLVLHRHLTNFLPGYQYGKHFGGVFYLFVRGMAEGSNYGIFFDNPDFNTLQRLNECLGGNK